LNVAAQNSASRTCAASRSVTHLYPARAAFAARALLLKHNIFALPRYFGCRLSFARDLLHARASRAAACQSGAHRALRAQQHRRTTPATWRQVVIADALRVPYARVPRCAIRVAYAPCAQRAACQLRQNVAACHCGAGYVASLVSRTITDLSASRHGACTAASGIGVRISSLRPRVDVHLSDRGDGRTAVVALGMLAWRASSVVLCGCSTIIVGDGRSSDVDVLGLMNDVTVACSANGRLVLFGVVISIGVVLIYLTARFHCRCAHHAPIAHNPAAHGVQRRCCGGTCGASTLSSGAAHARCAQKDHLLAFSPSGLALARRRDHQLCRRCHGFCVP